MHKLGSFRAIVFDAVGTLIYPQPSAHEVYFQVGQRFGSNHSWDEIRERFRDAFRRHFSGRISAAECDGQGPAQVDSTPPAFQPVSEDREKQRWRQVVWETLFRHPIEKPQAAWEEAFRELWAHFSLPSSWALFPDVQDTFEALLTNPDLNVAIASNFDLRLGKVLAGHPPFQKWLARNQGRLFVSSLLGFEKPSPQFFHAVSQQLCLPPADCLMVGDDARNDYWGARQAGWKALLLQRDRSFGVPTETTDQSLRSISSLHEIIDQVGR